MNTTNTQDPINPADVQVETVLKQMGSFAPVLTNGIKLTHTPTSISVTCTHERSAHANRAAAWRALEAALQPAAAQPQGDAREACGYESCDCRSYCKKQAASTPTKTQENKS